MKKKRDIVVPPSKCKKESKQYMTKRDCFTWSFVNYSTNTEHYKTVISWILEPNESDKKFETKDITVNDLFALMISEEQVNKILENKLHISKHEKKYIDENTKKLNTEWMNYFNNLLHESIDFYERVFHEKLYDTYIKKRSKDKLWKPICKNHKEVIKFLMYNSKNKSDDIYRSQHCFLLKIMRALNDFNIHQKKFNEAQKNFDEIKRKQILPNFKTPQGKEANKIENINHLTLRTSSGISNKDIIFFSMDSRVKEKDRIIVKMLSNSKYNTSKTIQDTYGIRNTVRRTIKGDKKSTLNHTTTKQENEEYKKKAILLLEYYRKMFPAEIDYKDLFGDNQDEVKELLTDIEKKYQLDETFKEMLLDSIKPKKERTGKSERKSGENYKEVKLKPIIKDEYWKYHSVEIQIIIEGNTNESWTAHHGIYEVKAVIEAEVRWRGFTTLDKIKLYINDVIERNIKECWDDENPDILYLWWLDRNKKYKELSSEEKAHYKSKTFDYIFNHIKNDFLKGQKLNYPDLYTTKTQREKFHNKENEDMYPADISRQK